MGQFAGQVGVAFHQRPSKMLGFHGTAFQELLFDSMCIQKPEEEEEIIPQTTRGKIMQRRMAEWPKEMLYGG